MRSIRCGWIRGVKVKMQQRELSAKLMKEYQKRIESIKDKKMRAFIKELDPRNKNNYGSYMLIKNVAKAFKALAGYEASECQTLDEIFIPKVALALELYAGKDEVNQIIAECKLLIECPYTVESYYRPSYRSSHVGTYAGNIFLHINMVFVDLLYEETFIQSLKRGAGNKM